MTIRKAFHSLTFVLLALLLSVSGYDESLADSGKDPLASWNDGENKSRILAFVESVTQPDSPDFVPEAERIATFDNDGNLWSEQPAYFQLFFAMDRVRELAPEHPEWQEEQPFKGVLEGDISAVMATGEEGLIKLVMATHAGMTTGEFNRAASHWLKTARHPRFDRLYTELVYQPMLELLQYLRDNGFRTFIVSGGGIDLVRLFSEDVYGIPPEQVVGSQIEKRFEIRDGEPVLVREPGIFFIDDKVGKPVGIDNHIGRRPILASGNSDGDLQMLQWTAAGSGQRLMLVLHHTDDEREWAYDRESHIGRLDAALDEANRRDWLVIDMAKDWKVIYPFELGN
jgi:hypothetical protein